MRISHPLLCALLFATACNNRRDMLAPPPEPSPTGGPEPGGNDGKPGGKPATEIPCEVIVAGGSTAALAAALTAAREGRQTCLVEPTDWPGGQMTVAGVPAIDFAWHSAGSVNVGQAGKDSANVPPELQSWLAAIGNPGNCWVSRHCYQPVDLLNAHILPALKAQAPRLRVLVDTVVKRVTTTDGGKTISQVRVVQRVAKVKSRWTGYQQRLSEMLPDWYSEQDSTRFAKRVFVLKSPTTQPPVVIDATEFGDVLVLAGASYLQGVEENEDAPLAGSREQCGQAFTFTFAALANPSGKTYELPVEKLQADHPEFYAFGQHDWSKIWTYRRLLGGGNDPHLGEISMQNWNPGNDYPYKYVFKDRQTTVAERSNWAGGVDLSAIEAAERHAYGYFRWYSANAPAAFQNKLELMTDVFGSESGLARFPYLRDTRRSVGIGGFVLKSADLFASGGRITGTPFADRIGIGAYPIDIHPVRNCSYPAYVDSMNHMTSPFFLPFRALTSRDVGNLLVAGKTMAQTFMANAATRLQPIEWSSGIGAGAAAAHMWERNQTSEQASAGVVAIQERVRKHAPLQWRVQGSTYP